MEEENQLSRCSLSTNVLGGKHGVVDAKQSREEEEEEKIKIKQPYRSVPSSYQVVARCNQDEATSPGARPAPAAVDP